MTTETHTRPITHNDLDFLLLMAQEAGTRPGSGRPSLEEAKHTLSVSRLVIDWGRPGDGGVIGEVDGRLIAAAWCRLYESPDANWAIVDQETPELAIAVVEDARGQGHGGRILDAAIAEAARQGHTALSLNVSMENPVAPALYTSRGFMVWKDKSHSQIMRLPLS